MLPKDPVGIESALAYHFPPDNTRLHVLTECVEGSADSPQLEGGLIGMVSPTTDGGV